MPTADCVNQLAVVPIGVVAYYLEPRCFRFKFPFGWRKASAHSGFVARTGCPVCPRLFFRHAAPLLVEPAHVYAKGIFSCARGYAEISASPDARHTYEIDTFVRYGREIHLIRIFAGEGCPLFCKSVGHSNEGRSGGIKRNFTGGGIDELPAGHRIVRLPCA